MRRWVRAWTKLPHDTTNCYIHADVRDGDLGVPTLRTSIPFMERYRLTRLANSDDPMISHLVSHSASFARECANCSRPPNITGYCYPSATKTIGSCWRPTPMTTLWNSRFTGTEAKARQVCGAMAVSVLPSNDLVQAFLLLAYNQLTINIKSSQIIVTF